MLNNIIIDDFFENPNEIRKIALSTNSKFR